LISVVDIVSVISQVILLGGDVDDIAGCVVDWNILEGVEMMGEGGIHCQVSDG